MIKIIDNPERILYNRDRSNLLSGNVVKRDYTTKTNRRVFK